MQVVVKNHIVSDLSKLGALLYETHIKVLLVLRYQGSMYVDPYLRGTITHSTRETEQQKGKSELGLEVIGKFGREGRPKFEKGLVGNIGVAERSS